MIRLCVFVKRGKEKRREEWGGGRGGRVKVAVTHCFVAALHVLNRQRKSKRSMGGSTGAGGGWAGARKRRGEKGR